jgi:Transposase DDE domain
LRRVLLAIDVAEFDRAVGRWLTDQLSLHGCGLALDGKTLCGSRDSKEGKAVHLLAAVIHGSGEVVAQTHVAAKTNEITCVAHLLEGLDITGAIVTADALLTQREIARHLVEDKQADYLFTVKDNQLALRQDIADLFNAREEDAQRRQPARTKPPRREAFPPSAPDHR